MKILFELNHPKHFHQFRHLIKYYKKNKNDVFVLAREKDVLLELLEDDGLLYKIFGRRYSKFIFKVFNIPIIIFTYLLIVYKLQPDIIISKASPYAIIIGKLLNIHTVITPDSEIVSLTSKFVAPYSKLVITQSSFKLNFGNHHKKISSFFEATYLHPDYFIPDRNKILEEGLSEGNKYFVLRFIAWDANHDINQFGFSTYQKLELVKLLEKYGRVIITSEMDLPQGLHKNVLKIHPSQIHHLLSYANLYVGDSQSMATEAALLGTPAIRFNSFVGNADMSNFKLLQDKYGLLLNCGSFDEVLINAKRIIEDPNSKKETQQKAKNYFQDIGDINIEIIQLINSSIYK